jgi:hypothetical protein
VAFCALQQHVTIEAGATFEVRGTDSGLVTFEGTTGTLILDQSSSFSGQVAGFSGNGNPSASDIIDLKDIAFGPGTTASYAGNANGGILTVSDAQHDVASISLVGNYENSTFSVSSDGSGGSSVVDPPATRFLSEGQFVFNDVESDSKTSVSVSAQHGGAGYVGRFTANTADGHDSVEWRLYLGPGTVQHVTQSHNISMTEPGTNVTGSSAPAPRSLVTIGGPGSGTFIFKPGFGTDVIANLTSSDTIELDGFSSISDTSALQTLLTEAQSGQAQSLFHAVNGGHDTAINLGFHDSIVLQNIQLANLHMNNFIVHPPLIG